MYVHIWALSMCETTRVFPRMSRRDFRHPQVIGQIILLSRVASHELSTSSDPLVGLLALFEGGFSVWPSMRSSVWECRTDLFVLSTCSSLSSLPSTSLTLDTGGGLGPPTPIVAGGPLVGFIVCHPPPKVGMTEALWSGMVVVGVLPLICVLVVSFSRFRRMLFP